MACCGGAPRGASVGELRPKVGDIFRAFGPEHRRIHSPSPAELRAMSHIEACRTEVLGGHRHTCAQCGHEVGAYNSCGDRHCPECQSFAQAKWIDGRKERILATGYFHLVFTLPSELRSVARCNPTVVYDLLSKTSAETLLELGRDPKHLGGLLGLTAVLHTWTRELDYHPHVHFIVTAGGLSPDGESWVPSKPDFLFPVRVMSKLFRGKFLHALGRARHKGHLEFAGNCARLADQDSFDKLMRKLYGKDWVVYCKEPFGGPDAVFEYLGRYTHRVAISNQRLISFDDNAVTFYTKNGGTKTLTPIEFIRRFLLHILPKGFTKIRHFGLHASGNVNTKLEKAKSLLAEANPQSAAALKVGKSRVAALLESIRQEQQLGTVCPKCGCREMIHTVVPAARSHQGPPVERNTS
jgi:ssDNA-binding Zn-finger/Zn-ribbon topoisomerase 1